MPRRRAPRPKAAAGPPRVPLAEALACLQRGDADGAARAAEAALRARPDSAPAHYLLGNSRLLANRPEEAATSYRNALARDPALAEAHNNLGFILERQGYRDQAAACYRAAIAARTNYPEAHNNLGNVLLAEGRAEAATQSFAAAVAARPAYVEAWYNLANALAALDRGEDAAAAYRKALDLRPGFVEALNNLAVLLVELERPAEALEAARRAVAADPGRAESHYNLGSALRDTGAWEPAIAAYRQAAILNPADARPFIAAGNILLDHDRAGEARVLFLTAQRLRPLTVRRGVKPVPDFTVLLLTAPGAANTPSDYLVGRAGYDSNFVALMAGVEPDLDLLRRSGDVVFNLISDVDHARAILPWVGELADRLGRPVLNHPSAIKGTGREAVAARLAGLPHCKVPRTLRLAPGEDPASALAVLAFPLLARVGGAHGGAELEKFDEPTAARAFLARRPRLSHYLTEFVPYPSADGHFRKYRLIFIDGAIYPYHLAIGDQWKVHHFSTDMENQEWMRREEAAFVADPRSVFRPPQWDALERIQRAIGLDYFGIDCGIDQAGDLVVFEVNATMLVHGERGVFAYKTPYIARIKDAFDAMLARAAGRAPRLARESQPGRPDPEL